MSRMTAAMHELRALSDANPGVFAPTSIAVIRNFTIEPIEPYAAIAGFRAGLDLRFVFGSYNPSAAEAAAVAANATVMWLALRIEELAPSLARAFADTDPAVVTALASDATSYALDLLHAARETSSARIVVNSFDLPLWPRWGLSDFQSSNGQVGLVRRMNLELADGASRVAGVALVDVDHVFGDVGRRACYDQRGDRTSAAPLTTVALDALGRALVRNVRALAGPRIKCLVVDCDNTLWGGVVGEDGIGGISLSNTGAGRRYQDFQRQLLDLRRRGTVLAICSKNELADVMEVLRKHPDCLVRETDFAAVRVNWQDKAANLLEIAAELNLSLEHVAFIDDDTVECASVAARLPAVTVIRFPLEAPELIDDLELFDAIELTGEDAARTEMYQAEAARSGARAGAASHEDFLRSLEITAVVGAVSEARLARLAQLTQKTNQFNLTTRRYEAAAIAELAAGPATAVRWLELADRFGSYGVVGLVIVRVADTVATIDTLLLSCRVLGRGVEAVLARTAAALARDLGADVLVGEYIPSQRNQQVEDMYGRLGFSGPEIDGTAQRWTLRLADGDPSQPDWISIVEAKDSE